MTENGIFDWGPKFIRLAIIAGFNNAHVKICRDTLEEFLAVIDAASKQEDDRFERSDLPNERVEWVSGVLNDLLYSLSRMQPQVTYYDEIIDSIVEVARRLRDKMARSEPQLAKYTCGDSILHDGHNYEIFVKKFSPPRIDDDFNWIEVLDADLKPLTEEQTIEARFHMIQAFPVVLPGCYRLSYAGGAVTISCCVASD
ncbi:MAG: hypothetical protein O2955_13860 [Planctomycetota bacterium]|nr:hypothetical protein [Planctomycetota bacterium]MDA1213596.1 hypothetical protein [Planctomycetota bacterium]